MLRSLGQKHIEQKHKDIFDTIVRMATREADRELAGMQTHEDSERNMSEGLQEFVSKMKANEAANKNKNKTIAEQSDA